MQIYNDFDLSHILWYRIGGKTKYFLVCENKKDIEEALDFVKKNQIKKIFVCGLGSNLIFTDDYFDGAVIQITSQSEGKNIKIINESTIESFSGFLLDDVIQFAFANNLTGLEWAGGLPGTVGAAVRGNVGAFGGEIKDVIASAEVLEYSSVEAQHSVSLANDKLQFVYRGSVIKTNKHMIVTSATFRLHPATQEELAQAKAIYDQNQQYRKDHHPLEYPNCGSVFKNLKDKQQIEKVLSIHPELKENVNTKWHGKIAVASLIERLGLKGYRVGNAQVSEKHALFIVNLGGATSRDVLKIIQDIQDKFQETFGFQLGTEVEIVK